MELLLLLVLLIFIFVEKTFHVVRYLVFLLVTLRAITLIILYKISLRVLLRLTLGLIYAGAIIIIIGYITAVIPNYYYSYNSYTRIIIRALLVSLIPSRLRVIGAKTSHRVIFTLSGYPILVFLLLLLFLSLLIVSRGLSISSGTFRRTR